MEPKRFFMVGGAGFIGSHFCDRLLGDAEIAAVTIYDNFSSGREWHYAHHQDARFRVVRGDVKEATRLVAAMAEHDTVIHLASNPDIARAATEPDIDFREGTLLTNHVVEAMRLTGVRTILYASGSRIYGDLGETEAHEDRGPIIPVSTYGASKLAGEALISSYSFMFGITGCAFRFGNVVGPRQTHGVGFDFIRQLLAAPDRLRILGDGSPTTSRPATTLAFAKSRPARRSDGIQNQKAFIPIAAAQSRFRQSARPKAVDRGSSRPAFRRLRRQDQD